MFSCACSLRSTQCAALIALAAAVGIARIEPARATERNSTDIPECSGSIASVSNASFRESAIQSLEPWFRLIRALTLRSAMGPAADHGGENATSSALPVGIPSPHFPTAPAHGQSFFVFPTRPALGPSAREHGFPFAVGPPPPQASQNHRADGTWVPDDVAARRKFVSPVVPSSFCFVARLACREFAGHRLAGPFFHPSSALRGEPALLPDIVRFRPCLCASGWRDSVIFSS